MARRVRLRRLITLSSILAGAVAQAGELRFRHSIIDSDLPGLEYGQTSLVDVDGDGDLDFITGRNQGGRDVLWFEHQARDRWVRHLLGKDHPSDVGGTAFDVDGDGRADHVSGGVWYRNPGNPREAPFERIVFDAELRAVHDLIACDLDGDRRLDVVTLSDRSHLRWYSVPGDPRQPWVRHDVGPGVHAGVAAADLDGDGDLDLVRSNVWLENADGKALRWKERANIPFGNPKEPYPLSTRCAPADIDRDGDLDLAMTENEIRGGRIAWLANADGKGGAWELHPLEPGDPAVRGAYHSIVARDFDGDDDIDVFSCEMEHIRGDRLPRWFIWENADGKGERFVERVILDVGLGGHEAGAGDADQDGDLDLAGKLWRPRPDNANGGRNHADFLENRWLENVPAAGPLRVSAANPRYFTDGVRRAIYLTGAHTWNNLADMGRDDPPRPFDFDAYLDLLARHRHNFIRLWAWDSSLWDTRANDPLGKDFVHKVAPLPWARTGPGSALDGGLRFDLKRFDHVYFDRLRSRVAAADRRGIYVSVMLFEGWGLFHGNRGRAAPVGWAWRSHPFHPENNTNGVPLEIAADGLGAAVHSLQSPAVNELQAAYVRRVVDAVNDLDNVLFEVINEGGEKEWNRWVVQVVRDHEKGKPKQHPVGLTGHGPERLDILLASTADWISPGSADGFGDDPPAWPGGKVSLLDTDHVWGVGGSRAWVWKSFLRGHNPLFMDPYDGAVLGSAWEPQWVPVRRAMGQARLLSERIDLAAMAPHGELSSTGYCLANPGKEYVVYQPRGGEAFSLRLEAGKYREEWLHPERGEVLGAADAETGGQPLRLAAPVGEDVVLHLKRR
jgi:hypothetical protein